MRSDQFLAGIPSRSRATGLGRRNLNIRKLIGSLSVLALCFVPVVSAQGTWLTRAPLPAPRVGAGSAVVNGLLYVFGGFIPDFGGPSIIALTTVYDPAANRWCAKTPMPTARMSPGVGVVNEIVYVMGGNNAAEGLATVEAYDPATDKWSAKAPMSMARSGFGVAAVDGILYALGGDTSGTSVEAYDSKTNTWAAKSPLPTPHFGPAVGVVGGVIYVAGGRAPISFSPSGISNAVDAFSPVTNTWTSRAPMLSERFDAAYGVIDGAIYVAGGYGRYAGSTAIAVTSVEAYDPAMNRWSAQAPIPTARGEAAAGAINGRLYVVGGRVANTTAAPRLDVNEVFMPPGPPVLWEGGISNAASFQVSQGIAPQSYVAIQGFNLAPDTPAAGRVWRSDDFVNGALPMSLDKVGVTIGGKPAAIEYISPSQINAIASADTPVGDIVRVLVTTSAGTSNAIGVKIQTFSPAFFMWPDNQPAATRVDFSIVAKNGTFPEQATVPAKPGEVIILWGNGFGPTTPPLPGDVVTPGSPVHNVATRPDITIGGIPAEFVSGAMSPGLASVYQIAVRVPALPAGDHAVRIMQGGSQGPDRLLLAVQ